MMDKEIKGSELLRRAAIPLPPVDDSMLERMARALWTKQTEHPEMWDGLHEADKDEIRDEVRVVVEILREPTDAVVIAGDNECFEWMSPDKTWTRQCFKEGWRAGIDAIMAGK